MGKKISIIIPCFNVNEYINRCLKSLVNQTIGIDNIEIILVDDASTDNTLELLESWEKKYSESIMVITYAENLRQGGARNVGLEYASGEYIGFVDADDWVEEDFYEEAYSIAQKGDYDVVRGKFERCKSKSDRKSDKITPRLIEYHFKTLKDGFFKFEVGNVGSVGEYGSICTGIYKRDLIINSGVWFPEKMAYEDNYWDSCLKLHISSLCIIDRVIYHYFINENSTVTARNQIHQLDRLEIEQMILDYYKEKGLFEICYKDLLWQFVNRYYLSTLYILFLRFDVIPVELVNEMRNTVREQFPDFAKHPNVIASYGRQKMLIELLGVENDLTFEELAKVKLSYLESICKEKEIVNAE